MREIKFRAWWVSENKMLFNVQNFYDTLSDKDNGNDYEPVNSFGQVLEDKNEFKVMQFTGLLDKNGKEIYEGDVVSYYHNGKECHREAVSWGVCGFDMLLPASDYEVVGNIYENP